MSGVAKRAGAMLAAGIILVGATGASGVARADKKHKEKNVKIAQAQSPIESLRLTRGQKITLPLDNVTRILTGDEEIVRGRFENGQPVLEGVTVGVTTLEIRQGKTADGSPVTRHYEVEVLEPGALPAPAIAAPVLATPETATPVTATTATTQTTTTTTVQTSSTPAIVPDETPALIAIAPVATSDTSTLPIVPTTRVLAISLGVEPAEDNPSQALFTITYGNPTVRDVHDVVIRYALDDLVSYVTGSATGGGRYDAAARELSWNIGDLPAGKTGQTATFRIQALDPSVDKFYSATTIESEGGAAVASNQIEYTFHGTPLLTVFALPDHIIAGRAGSPFLDVNGTEYRNAIERLRRIGVVQGEEPSKFGSPLSTQRVEYTVMILRSLNLKDLRDMSAIKFVLSRRASVTLQIRDEKNKVVATLLKNSSFESGERTVLWNGTTAGGYAAPGRYSYTCTARDLKNTVTTLKGFIYVVPQTPVVPDGVPSFVDVRANAWYTGLLAVAEKQGLVNGYPLKTGSAARAFRPESAINRVEATAIVVRAIGLDDLAKNQHGKEAGFLDDHMIPDWATGYVYVASTIAKTSSGKLIVGYPSNMYMPLKPMRRDEAALVIERLVDKETNRKIGVSGQLVPGASVTINDHKVAANDDGSFAFTLEQNSTQPTSIAVLDRKQR